MTRSKEEFVKSVEEHLSLEHDGRPFEHLRPQIEEAYESEGQIEDSQLVTLIHGAGDGVPDDLRIKYPRLDAVSLRTYVESIGDTSEEDDEEDMDEDDEEEGEEDEEDDED